MFNTQYGSLRWIWSCQPFVFGEKGMLFVLAGEPDAEPCWDLSLWHSRHITATGGTTLLIDATMSNTYEPGDCTVGVAIPRFDLAVEACVNSGLGHGDLAVIHSLDAFADWDQHPGFISHLTEYCLASGLTTCLHTKYMGSDFGIFGDSLLNPYASVTLLVRVGGLVQYVHGRELVWVDHYNDEEGLV